jgi:hypothetical protein
MRAVCLFAVSVNLAAAALAADEDSPIRFLTLKDNGGTETDFTILPDRDLLLPFSWLVPEEGSKTFDFFVTSFLGNEQGDYLTPDFGIVELPAMKPAAQRLTVPLEQPILTLRLRVAALPPSGKYSGHIVVVHDGTVVRSAAVTVTRAAPARPVRIVIDQPAVRTTDPIWPRWPSGSRSTFSILVRNENKEWPARNVFVRVKEVSSPDEADLDPDRHLRFTWNGSDARDLLWTGAIPEGGTAEPTVERSIPAGQQAIITGRAHERLAPGEYVLKLAVAAENADPSEHPEVTVTIRVRHSVLPALVVLVVAILLSFMATKGLQAQRRRVEILRRVAELRSALAGDMQPLAPVVAVRAALKQAETQHKSWWRSLFSPDIVGQQVDRAALVVPLLQRVHRLGQRFNDWDRDLMIRNRANKRLSAIAEGIDYSSMDDSQAARINTQLDELEMWLTSNQLETLYWTDLEGDVMALNAQVAPETFAEGTQRDVVASLTSKIAGLIGKLDQPAGDAASGQAQNQNRLAEYIEIERYYAKLKILWERNANNARETLEELVASLDVSPEMPIETFFQQTDNLAWRGLEEACKTGKLKFTSPRRSSFQPLQAYQLIQFQIAPQDPRLENTYLFKHKLRFDWKLTVSAGPPNGVWHRVARQIGWWPTSTPREPVSNEDVSQQPRIVQYVPFEGQLGVGVQLQWDTRVADEVCMDRPPVIGPSSDFGWKAAFRASEMLALAVAALFAIVSGLGTLYFNGQTFGTPENYIALFVWGAGVDQAKNFVQNLAQVSSRTA